MRREGGYTEAIDMWSIGIITCCLIHGEPPFAGHESDESGKTILEHVGRHGLVSHFKRNIAPHIGSRAANFIERLCALDENKRMTADEALDHAWFVDDPAGLRYERLYQKIILTWTARKSSVKIVEEIPTSLNGSANPQPSLEQVYSIPSLIELDENRQDDAGVSKRPPKRNCRIISSGDESETESDPDKDIVATREAEDFLAQEMENMSVGIDLDEPSLPRPPKEVKWEMSLSDEEEDIESSESDCIITKSGKLPLRKQKSNQRPRVEKAVGKAVRRRGKNEPKVLKHAFRRQYKPFIYHPDRQSNIGDGFEQFQASKRSTLFN